MLTPFHPRRAYRLLLLGLAVGSIAIGLSQLLLPEAFNTGPTTAVLYAHVDRPVWGAAFLIAGLLCLGAAYYDELWFGIIAVLFAWAFFAFGLAWVIIATHRGNVLGPIAWAMVTWTALTAAYYQRR